MTPKPQQTINEKRPIVVDGYVPDRSPQEEVAIAHEALAATENPYKAPIPPQVMQEERVTIERPYNSSPESQSPAGQVPNSPAKESSGGMGQMLAAATPLLVDFVMGGSQGTKISSDAFLKLATPTTDKAKNDLEIQKLKLAAERIKTDRLTRTGSDKPLNKNQVATFLKPDGTKELATWNQGINNGWTLEEGAGEELIKSNQVGDYFVPEKGWMKVTHSEALKKGYKPLDTGVTRYNQTQSIDKALDRESREKLAAQRIAEMKQQKKGMKEIKAFENFSGKNSKYSQAESKVYGAISAMDMLNKGGVIGENGLPTIIAKQIFGEVGNLSATDLQASNGNQSAVSLAQRLYQKMLGNGGKLGPEDRKDVEIVIKAAYDHNAWQARNAAERTSKGYRTMGVDTSAIDDYVNIPALPALSERILSTREQQKAAAGPTPNRANKAVSSAPASGKIQVSNGTEAYMIDQADLADAEKDGFKKVN